MCYLGVRTTPVTMAQRVRKKARSTHARARRVGRANFVTSKWCPVKTLAYEKVSRSENCDQNGDSLKSKNKNYILIDDDDIILLNLGFLIA